LISGREQFYIDSLSPEYYINPTAGSRLGALHTKETIVLMSLAKTGDNHPMFGRTHSAETKAKMSKAQSGENHYFYGKSHSEETLAKISIAKGGGAIYVNSSDGSTLINSFPSARKAAEFFNCSHHTIIKYANSGKVFKEKWLLSLTLISS
jgi:group I intron endonuclease